jgi:hypothetical protein
MTRALSLFTLSPRKGPNVKLIRRGLWGRGV